MNNHAGRTIIVTGAGSGIGRATAIRLAGEGATVHCVDVANVDTTAKEDPGPGALIAHTMDASDETAWTALVEEITGSGGRIDSLALVHGVLAQVLDTVVGQNREQFERVLTINLTADWIAMKAVLPTMIAQGGGSCVLVTSGAAVGGIKGLAAYASSKGGVISLVKQAAIEYARQNIRVNAVAPGIVETPMLAGADSFLNPVRDQTPMGRLGRPDEIAAGISFLASDDAGFITGQVLGIDGGLLSQGAYT
ncbi:3-oxoacyl-[acyl-carrier-protein] reductase [Sporichthya brevicatena]|uniref:3-oxoacyl-[acyl-carrier-protein] reductase n=1 Tax=Sporichthya brevicatena TaxID=171442 RepID=A0ABP3S734_9ACTN